MMLRYTFGNEAAGAAHRGAVKKVLAQGFRTGDIYEPGTTRVGTRKWATRYSRRCNSKKREAD
jgi:3-isopropylmalate dehydrogenase